MSKQKIVIQKVKEKLDNMPGNTVELKKEMAEFVGVSAWTVNRWYGNPDAVIEPANYPKVCEFLNCELSELVFLK